MGYWYIDFDGTILGCVEPFDEETERKRKEIGNYFDTEAEAEEALEKLKLLHSLKERGVKVVGVSYSCNLDLNGCEFNGEDHIIGIQLPLGDYEEAEEELKRLLGGEE